MLFRSDRKSTRLNSSHTIISYAVFCLKKKRTSPDGRGRLHAPGGGAFSAASAGVWRGRGSRGGVARVAFAAGCRQLFDFFFLKARPPPKSPLFPPPNPFPL